MPVVERDIAGRDGSCALIEVTMRPNPSSAWVRTLGILPRVLPSLDDLNQCEAFCSSDCHCTELIFHWTSRFFRVSNSRLLTALGWV